VSRIPTSMEVWSIRPDGSVQDSYWYEGSQWNHFTLALASSASPEGGITAVSRIPGSMEVWWIGQNGSVQAAFWYDGGNGDDMSYLLAELILCPVSIVPFVPSTSRKGALR
jgi:hypothetical protein